MKSTIPASALDDRLGWVGTSGSGKTYNAGGGVEQLLRQGARVVIVDPLDVWFGLRLLPDGKTPSPHSVVIFGGAHADLPLNEHAGALIGETVAGMAESCIVSLGGLGTKAAERRFMLAFLETLYRKATGEPLHVIFDEADLWAPQKAIEPMLQNLMEQIVRRGRVKGFIPWLITQRPAVISKDVLSQVDGLVVFKLTSSQDRDALEGWIEGQADREQWRAIRAQLPTMDRGVGVIWIPGRGVLETKTFPEKATFDSSRTPKRGEKKRSAELAPLDLPALKERLAKVEAETKANDPKVLRARIAELERAAAKGVPSAEPAALAEARRAGHEAGVAEGSASTLRAMGNYFERLQTLSTALAEHAQAGIEDRARALRERKAGVSPPAASASPASRSPRAAPAVERAAPAQRQPAPVPRTNGAHPPSTLPKAERRILTALAQYTSRTKNQVAMLAGYAVNGGGFNNSLSALRSKGFIEGAPDRLTILPAGLQALGPFDPLPTGAALLEHWFGQIGKAERAILQALADAYPRALTKQDLGVATMYEPNGGGFNNALSRLRTLELIEGRGELRASDDFFQ